MNASSDSAPPASFAHRALPYVLAVLALVLYLGRMIQLDADVPVALDRQLARDGVFYTDEGWYAINAISLHRWGSLYQPGEMNFLIPLPAQQLLHLPTFAVLGPTIIAARMTTILCFGLLAFVVFSLASRWGSRSAGLFALFLLLTNYFIFVYSRVGLSEIPMITCVLLSIGFALKGGDERRGWINTALATFFFFAAMMIKTSALPAFPAFLLALASANWSTARWWLRPVVAFLAASALLAAHRIATGIFFPHEISFFYSINVGMQLDINIYNALMRTMQLQNDLRRAFPVLRYAIFYAIPILVLLLPPVRRNPLVHSIILFAAGYTAVLAVYGNPQPRYWVPYVPCAFIILGIIWEELLERARTDRRWKVAAIAWGVMGLVAIAGDARSITKVLREPSYSMRDTTLSINELIRKSSGMDPREAVLLGHYSHTIALYGGPRPLNDLYGSLPLAFRLDTYHPQFMLTQDPIETNLLNQAMRKFNHNPADYRAREDLIRSRYELEELAVFDVLANYEQDTTHLYRLHPKK